MPRLLRLAPIVAALALASTAHAAVVTGFDAAFTANGSWFTSQLTAGGSAAVVDLSGAGGNLETAQPLPSGAARLTTNNTNSARAEVAVRDNYGKAGDILSTLALHYSYWRENAPGQNTAAAPSIKLTFFNPTYVGDGFVTLVYEQYWNNPGNADPASQVWTGVDIDFDSGLFWQNGGFGQPNTAGGPPLNTLQGWLAAFDAGFSGADLVAVSVGIGTFNPGITSYFDDVRISHGFGNGYSASYDFQAAAAVPEPASLALAGLALAGAAAFTRRRRPA